MMLQTKNSFIIWWFILLSGIVVLAWGIWWKNASPPGSQLNPLESASHREAPTTSLPQRMAPLPLPPLPTQSDSGDDRITTIMGDESLGPQSAVIQLIKALPSMDSTSQEEAANHIANLSDDASATNWTQKLVSNQLPAPVAEILFNNLLSRSEELVLPTLAAIADQPNHTQQSESVQILEPLIGTPKPGFTWIRWSKQGR